jgi:hypothetical protein
LSFREEDSWFLLHNNAPVHSTLIVKRFLANSGAVLISHPTYLPNLALKEFFIFAKAKISLKGRKLQNMEEI